MLQFISLRWVGWEEAIEYLITANKKIQEWPDLAFIQGVINSAMLLPIDMRHHALEMNLFSPEIHTIEGEEADHFRKTATASFELAENMMVERGLVSRAGAAHDWMLWLRLTDPQQDIVQEARQEVQESMKEGRRAIDLLPLAKAFNISFDESPIRRHLAGRAQVGGLDDRELVAKLMLAEATMDARDLAEFIRT